MSRVLNIEFDSGLLDAISADFDLREPNKQALRQLIFTLDGGYDSEVMQVLNLATGVGKTYLMAAFIEYLRRNGVGNVVIVTPGKTVQAKTVQNFSQGSTRYISGSPVPPEVVTPQDYSAWIARTNGPAKLSYGREVPMLAFIFNIQQLIAPSNEEGETRGDGQQAQRRRPRRFDENAGVLFEYLRDLEDLVVIADESHLYSVSAASFNSALKELNPAATVGLTASVAANDHVIFRYPLYQAIKDQYVKVPVLAFRRTGYGDDIASEEQQLSDAVQLRAIKQTAYDSYVEYTNQQKLNAVLFVVCADTDHATQVSTLLRSPRYFGSDSAVLQVDSNHDDENTLRLLDMLDAPNSPTLAVVSVNKLKEGWDVKNIAVVVTLRAMASEVLTQQTMGRGLRLPFGKYTGVLQLDQLDIISHQSFKELLEEENVLEQFGLEDAVQDPEKVVDQIKNTLSNKEAPSASTSVDSSSDTATGVQQSFSGSYSHHSGNNGEREGLTVEAGEVTNLSSTGSNSQGSLFDNVGIREITDVDTPEQPKLELIKIERNPEFADESYLFPRTRITLSERKIDLSEIPEVDIKTAAERVTSTGDVLVRKQLVAALGKTIRAVDTESAEVDSVPVDTEDAETALVRVVLNGQLVPPDEANKRLARGYLVKKFMQFAPIDHWTVKALASADAELAGLVKSFVNNILRNRTEETYLDPLKMPRVEYVSIPLGETIHEPIESQSEFERGRFYGEWFKSLFEAESFDSYTGEYLLAKLLNTSPNIAWWQRLHTSDGAYIYYNPKDRYFPDFVALDTDGIYWIIEGKDKRGRTDDVVQAKRLAAERVVHRLIGEDDFANQKWGYLIAYEDDIQSSESWNDLKAKSQPISNA